MKDYLDYNNKDMPYIPAQDPRSINVVENIRNEAAAKKALPRLNDDTMCQSSVVRMMATPRESVRIMSPTGKVFEITVDDEGQITPVEVAAPDFLVGTTEELQEAVNAGGIVRLISDITGGGIIFPSNVNCTVDFAGYTYTVINPTVGSTGTQTLGFQLLKDSHIVFRNGIIATATDDCKMIIQNYSNLTLQDMTIDGTGSANMQYVFSTNNGVSHLTGETNIIAPDYAVAIDAYYWPKAKYESVHLTVNTTGTITGKVQLTHDETATEEMIMENSSLIIHGGTFSLDPSTYVQDNTVVEVEGMYRVA